MFSWSIPRYSSTSRPTFLWGFMYRDRPLIAPCLAYLLVLGIGVLLGCHWYTSAASRPYILSFGLTPPRWLPFSCRSMGRVPSPCPTSRLTSLSILSYSSFSVRFRMDTTWCLSYDRHISLHPVAVLHLTVVPQILHIVFPTTSTSNFHAKVVRT